MSFHWYLNWSRSISYAVIIEDVLRQLLFLWSKRGNGKIEYTNVNNSLSVTFYDFNCNILWRFCHTGILVCPFGLSVDNDGNVFVVGWSTHNVLVISPDGQHFRQLLSRKDGLMNRQAIHYDKSTNRLLVSLRTSEAWLFKVNWLICSYI